LHAVVPSLSWKVPRGHGLQVIAPFEALKEPVAHSCGAVEPVAQEWPSSQTVQLCCDMRPVPLPKRPAAQGVGLLAPVSQKAPWGHASQLSWALLG
tara:strand:- start:542 stop:829 length:288 start_codon:yes stop_codon:yes gene_type:complete